MHPKRQRRIHSFTWQVLLILLPLILLAALGIASLRQDRLLARQTATERAVNLAEALLPEIWQEVRGLAQASRIRFSINLENRLVHPPRPDTLELLPNLQHATHTSAERQFQAALLELRAGRTNDAIRTFLEVLTQHAGARGETGLRLDSLAAYKMLELRSAWPDEPALQPVTVDAVCSNLVTAPHPLTPLLLERIAGLAQTSVEQSAVRNWQQTLELHERAAQAYDSASSAFENLWNAPAILPFDSFQSGSSYLVAIASNETTRTLAVLDRKDLEPRIQAVMKGQTAVPDYMNCAVDLAGERLCSVVFTDTRSSSRIEGRPGKQPDSKGQSAEELLASRAVSDGAGDLVRVRVFLGNPSALYAEQRTRTYWFAGLIVVSSGAALLGLLTAWKSFREQERLSLLKSDFVSSVSHELRAPIASVRLMAENLECGRVPEESKQMDYFRFIGQECRRLSALIENVLDFSRIEQNRKQYEFDECDLVSIVRSTIRLMQPVARERNITLRTSELSSIGSFHRKVDGKALQQALVNLVDNAIKHSPPDSEVIVGLSAPDGAKPSEVWVEDRGEGIPAAEHGKIFERFYRRGSELRRETQGVGIGLSIVKHVVDAHGGQIHVRSAPGEGSRFTIILPNGVENGTEPAAGAKLKS